LSPIIEPARPRSAKPSVVLTKIGAEPAPLELKVRLPGELAETFKDYQRAYLARHGEAVEGGALAARIIAAFIEADRGFATWRKANPEGGG
jgi:hypothetical protein